MCHILYVPPIPSFWCVPAMQTPALFIIRTAAEDAQDTVVAGLQMRRLLNADKIVLPPRRLSEVRQLCVHWAATFISVSTL